MMSVRVILNSGVEFTVRCEEFAVKRGGFGDFLGYEFDGIVGDRPKYIRVSEIAAMIQMASDEGDVKSE